MSRIHWIAAISSGAALILLSACGGGGDSPTPQPPAPAPVAITVSIASSNGGGGSVQCSVAGAVAAACASYPPGTTVLMTATANGASDFAGWSGGGCSGTGTCSLALTANTAIAASFNRPTLSVQVSGIGSISSTPAGIDCGTVCTAAFDKGASVTLAAAGAGFAGWSGASCGSNNPCVVALNQTSSLVATFNSAGLPPFAQQAYLKASNTERDDDFGHSVALSGNTLAIGAQAEDSAASGVNGNQADNGAQVSGAVYVFTRTGDVWSQQAYLKASNPRSVGRFGISVALSGDTLVVGAEGDSSNARGVNGNQLDTSAAEAGAAYVFVRNAGVWSQQAYLKASNTETADLFGRAVAVDGDTIVVGAPGERSSATGINGNQADNGAPYSGAAYVFTRTGTVWSQQAYVKASNTEGGDIFGSVGDFFGGTLALSGDTLAVGARNEDSSATGVNGNQADNGATDSGAVYVFVRTGNSWSQQAYVKASNTGANFGFSQVALSGDTLAVGATGESTIATSTGATYVFTRTGGVWSQQALLKASNAGTGNFTNNQTLFGSSVAVVGDRLVAAARAEASDATGVNGDQSNTNAIGSGAVYVFTRTAGTWAQQAYVKASNTGAGDDFGFRVALSADTFVVSAAREDSNATGVAGNQADNSAPESGAAYVFIVQ